MTKPGHLAYPQESKQMLRIAPKGSGLDGAPSRLGLIFVFCSPTLSLMPRQLKGAITLYPVQRMFRKHSLRQS
jgi:hypothetical protein